MTIQPTIERAHPAGSGTQKLYRFDNDFGASVVRFTIGSFGGSYGVQSGLWELAVLKFHGPTLEPEEWELTYDTPITDDVIGHLDDGEVEEVLGRIRDLPSERVRAGSTVGELPAIASGEESAR
jgi:hypothetical protein